MENINYGKQYQTEKCSHKKFLLIMYLSSNVRILNKNFLRINLQVPTLANTKNELLVQYSKVQFYKCHNLNISQSCYAQENYG